MVFSGAGLPDPYSSLAVGPLELGLLAGTGVAERTEFWGVVHRGRPRALQY